MRNLFLTILIPCALGASCASATREIRSTPAGQAAELVDQLDAGQVAEAERGFEAVCEAQGAETLYPALFHVARQRHDTEDYAGAGRVLGFMAECYPDAAAVREARLYSLFLERSSLEAPDPALTSEIDEALADVRGALREPVWVDLIAAQQSIDRGELTEARSALQRFGDSWNGDPEALGLYVDDLQRYLAAH